MHLYTWILQRVPFQNSFITTDIWFCLTELSLE